jgi:hypothetical protein
MQQFNILILTATVKPRLGVPNLSRIDPSIRLNDYYEAFDFYLTLLGAPIDYIIFAENSNSDIDSLKKLAHQSGVSARVEFISFDGLNYPPEYDRGYGEFKLIDHVMLNSHAINSRRGAADCQMIFWKVTGRYIIRNLASIVVGRPEPFDLYCNYKNYRQKLDTTKILGFNFRGFERRKLVDMFLFAWTLRGYLECIKDVYIELKSEPEKIKLHVHPEESWRRILDREPELIKIVRRFRLTPEVHGVRAGDNNVYQTESRWKFILRDATRVLLPWLWI